MATLPQLSEEDIRKLNEALQEFLTETEATVALIIDKAGFLLTHQGREANLDLITLSALASGAFMASQSIAGLVQETDFNHTVLQGGRLSLFTTIVDQHCLLLVLYPSQTGLGVVKYYSGRTINRLARQLAEARERDPEGGLDLSELNVADPREFFRKKTA